MKTNLNFGILYVQVKDRFQVVPKRVARGRKIQVRPFEPEEIWIEYELTVTDPTASQEAVDAANQLAIEFLDTEEMKLRKISSQGTPSPPPKPEYQLEVTPEGKGALSVSRSQEPQFKNFLHLWTGKDKEVYVGHLKKTTDEFTFKAENKSVIQKMGIKLGTHFRVVKTPG